MLNHETDMEVIGLAATGEEALDLFIKYRPDVTIMDMQLPTMSGLEAIICIRRIDPQARIIVLTMHQGEEDIHRAITAGATTYVLKDALFDELVDIVRDVAAGAAPVPPNVARLLTHRASQQPLTPREIAVLELFAEGLRNKEIADRLGISEHTIKVHVKNLFAKLDVSDRTAALSLALQRGIIHLK